jgi:hypothetical protein
MVETVQIALLVVTMVAAAPTFIFGLAIREQRLRGDRAS